MEKKLVAIASEKGGTGKTTMTLNVATAIHNNTDYKVAIIDVEPDQRSAYSKYVAEKTDIESLEDSTINKAVAHLKNKGKEPIVVYSESLSDFTRIAQITKENDITFIDFPGSLSIDGVKELLFFIEYVFVPCYSDFTTFNSNIRYLHMLRKFKDSGKSRIKDYFAFPNRYSKIKNKEYIDGLMDYFKKNDFKTLSPVYEKVFYQRNQSTIISEKWSSVSNNIYPFSRDLLNNIGLTNHKL